jgi:hypothetical protein
LSAKYADKGEIMGLADRILIVGVFVLAVFYATTASGEGWRQPATGGGTMIEGAAGGGIVPWAVLNGYATKEQVSGTGFYSRADTDDYQLEAAGAAVNLFNRVELSYARQRFDLETLGPALGFPGATLEQDIFGAKYRVYGDLVYSRAPQVSLGVQYKRNRDFQIPSLVGAQDDTGLDLYASAAKLFLAGAGGYNLFLNGTLRYTEANETGLLGFGGPGSSGHDLRLEAAAAVLLSSHLAVGAEYRQKSSQLQGLPEDDWYDLFVAYFPNRHFSVVAAYLDLGEVATLPEQRGWYLSAEVNF